VDRTRLEQQDAVLLAHALVARLAEQVGARVLFIKGPTAVALGARPPRPSSDVDVLVEPTAFDLVCGALEECGWKLRVPSGRLRFSGDFAFDHSAHYIHGEWPCDLDVHYNFPGFLADPAAVFDALWDRRTTVDVAGRPVPTPDLLGQSLVVGLHAVRDPHAETMGRDLEHLAEVLRGLSRGSARDLRDLARDTGASGSASQVLALAGIEPHPLSEGERARLVDWRLRQRGLGAATAWLAELQAAPWKLKPSALRRALVPPPDYFVGSHLAPQLTRWQLTLLHLRRWGRGVVAAPSAVRVLSRRRHRAH